MNQKPFQNAEREFLLLKGQLATNRITRAQFDTALEKLNVRDEFGRAWRMEPESGAWQIQQNDAWLAADPKSPPPAPAKDNAVPMNMVPIFAGGAILLFCACVIGAFALLNKAGLFVNQVSLFPTATTTFSASLATSIPFKTDTSFATSEATNTSSAGTPSPIMPRPSVTAMMAPTLQNNAATPTSFFDVVPTILAPTSVAVKPGVYVSNLRLNPRAPKRGELVTFFVTFLNSTGKAQNAKWFVEIWEANSNKKNAYGQADALKNEIPSGTNERATGSSWKVAGGGPCIPFRARVVYQDSESRRIPYKQPNGAELWKSFQVCP